MPTTSQIDRETPAISVVMPVHNALPFLDAAIESILAQSHGDFEFVILDDASTDGSAERLKEWAARDRRIRLLHAESKLGPALGSQRVALAARAALVARMDADDISHPDRLRDQVAVFRRHPETGIVASLCDFIDASGETLRACETWRLTRRSVLAPFAHGAMMYRRSLFGRVGGYREECVFWEDQDLIARMAALAPVLLIPRPLYQYRLSTSSTRLASDQEQLEHSVDLMFRSAERLQKGETYEDLLPEFVADGGKVNPRVFVSLGSQLLWAGGRPKLFGRMLRRSHLALSLNTVASIVWTAWASLSPGTLRGFLRLLVRTKNASAASRVRSLDAVPWNSAGLGTAAASNAVRLKDWPLGQIVRKFAPALPVLILLGLLASALEGAGISLIIPLLSMLLSNHLGQGVPGPLHAIMALLPSDGENRILLLGSAIVALILFKGLVQAANGRFAAYTDNHIAADVRTALAKRLLSLDYPFYLEHDPTRLARILTTDSWFVSEAIRSALALLPAAITVAVFGALLAWLNPVLFLIVAVGTAVIQSGLYLFERRQRRLSQAITAADQTFWARVGTLVNAPRVIRLFGQQAAEEAKFATVGDRFRQALSASRYWSAVVNPTVESAVAVLFVLIILVGYRTGMGLPAMTAFVLLLSRLQAPASVIRESRLGIASASGSLREVNWLLDQRPAPSRVLTTIDPAPVVLDDHIVFDRVSFSYPNGAAALREASFRIRPGVATALIGQSGAGKTTIVNLLCRLMEPQAGSIYLGRRAARSIGVAEWRARIAVAGQDAELIDGTIAENIAYGRPDASQSEIQEVARVAGATGFIAALPEGYDTPVGQNGLNLSGGQRQRIALARALLRKPDLLVLDEATSAVDALSELETIKLLSQHRFFRSALVISHRKSTLAACEDGIVIDEGRICESGSLPTLAYFRTMAGPSDAAA